MAAVDTTPPETTIDSGPSGPTSNPTPTFTFHSSEAGSSFECSIGATNFGPCSGPGASHTPPGPLPEGPQNFRVRATDAAGNTDPTPDIRSFTVDTQAPSAPSLTGTSPDLTGEREQPQGARRRRGGLDGAALRHRRLHGLGGGDRHGGRAGEPGDRRLGRRQLDHRAPRHRDRRRRQHVAVLGAVDLLEQLDPERPEDRLLLQARRQRRDLLDERRRHGPDPADQQPGLRL